MIATDPKTLNEQIPSEGLALIDVWARWCGPCRMYSPVLARFSEISGKPVYSIEADEHMDYVREQKISTIPTVLVYFNGKEVQRLIGARPYAQLLDELEPWSA